MHYTGWDGVGPLQVTELKQRESSLFLVTRDRGSLQVQVFLTQSQNCQPSCIRGSLQTWTLTTCAPTPASRKKEIGSLDNFVAHISPYLQNPLTLCVGLDCMAAVCL